MHELDVLKKMRGFGLLKPEHVSPLQRIFAMLLYRMFAHGRAAFSR